MFFHTCKYKVHLGKKKTSGITYFIWTDWFFSYDVKVYLAVIPLSLLEAMAKDIAAELIHSVYFPHWALMCPSPHPLQWKHHQL